jgi:UDP-N-acetylglucosamine/UDP-N-acetylgalactosamine diphosphorylase
MNHLHRGWLKEAGAEVAAEAQVEISPLFAQDKEELLKKLKGKKLVIREDKYIE